MARGSQFVVDLNVIETECENLEKCYEKYTNNTYSYFKNSYLTKCTDNKIKNAINKISKYYKTVDQDYNAICNWWKSYIDNVKGLENYLSGKGASTLSEQSLINYLRGSLEKLQEYNFDIGILYSNINKKVTTFDNQININKDINDYSIGKNTYNGNSNFNSVNDNINIDNLNGNSNFNNTNKFNSANTFKDKVLNNGTTNYNGKLNIDSDNIDFIKNSEIINGINSYNPKDLRFDSINNAFKDNSYLNGHEVTFEDIFGKTSQTNTFKTKYSDLANIDINNPGLKDININVNRNREFANNEGFKLNQASFSLVGGTALGIGFGVANKGKNSSQNNSSNDFNYTQGKYNSEYTDIDRDNSGFSNGKNANNQSVTNNNSYVYTMGTQNIESTNYNSLGSDISSLTQRIIGLIKSIKTNSKIICQKEPVKHANVTDFIEFSKTKAEIRNANSINVENETEIAKTGATSKPNVLGAVFNTPLVASLSKIFSEITASSMEVNDGKAKINFDTFVDNAYIKVVTSFNNIKEKISKFLSYNTLLPIIKENGSEFFNSLSIKMSHSEDDKYVEKNQHIDLDELCEWTGVEILPIAKQEATKELENANLIIDNYYNRYGDLSDLAYKLDGLKQDENGNYILSAEDRQELMNLIFKVNNRSNLSDELNSSELDKELDILVTKLSMGENLTQDYSELINNLVGLLCAEKSMDKQIIHQLEIGRDQIPYKYVSKNLDYNELSDYSIFCSNCKYDSLGNVIEPATIAYDENTASWVINGKSYNVDDGSFESLDKLTLCYLYNNGKLVLANDGEMPWSMQEYLHITQYLTEDEVKKYHYLYEKYGIEEASKYLDSMEDELNQRQGLQQAMDYLNSLEGDNLVEKAAQLHLSGIGDGIVQFYEGLEDVIGADGVLSVDQYKQMYLLQIMNGQIDVDALEGTTKTSIDNFQNEYELTGASLGKFYQTGVTVGNMLPSMAVSAIITPFAPAGTVAVSNQAIAKITNGIVLPQAISCSLIGLSAGGNAKNQALHDGASESEANFTGFLSGLAEGGLEYLLGNIPGLSKETSNTLLGFFKEGGQECIQQFADMCIRMHNGEYVSFEQFTEEEIDTFIMSVITSAEMNGGNALISAGAGLVTIPAGDITKAYNEGGFNAVKELINENISNNQISYVEPYESVEAKENAIVSDNLGDINIDDIQIEEINEVSNNNPTTENDIDLNIDDIILEGINENSNNNSTIEHNMDLNVNNNETLNNKKSEYLFTRMQTLATDFQAYINSQIESFNQKMIDNKAAIKQRLTDLGVNVFSVTEILTGYALKTISAPAAIVFLSAGMARLVLNNMLENGSKHSLFKIMKLGNSVVMAPTSLEQFVNVTKEMKQVIEGFDTKLMGLGASLTMQLANTMLQLPQTNSKGDVITYTGVTHETVVKLLVELQKRGFIKAVEDTNINHEGLKEVEVNGKKYKVKYIDSGLVDLIGKGKSYKVIPLTIEKFLLGNFKEALSSIFHKKANSKLAYEIKFQLTDKIFNEEAALDMMRIYNKALQKSNSNYEIGVLYDKDGSPYIGLKNRSEVTESNEQTVQNNNTNDTVLEEINESVNNDIKHLDLDKTWDMITISTLKSIINNPEIVDKFLNFDNNLDYFGTNFSKKRYFETFDDFKNEIDAGHYKISDDAYKNLTKLLAPNLKQQIITNNVDIDTANVPFEMLENIIEIEEIRNKFLEFDNNIDYFDGISKQQYLNWFKEIENAIIDDQLMVSESFKKNLSLILSDEMRNIHPSFTHTFYALSKLDDIFLNFFFNSGGYGPNQGIIKEMLKNPQKYKDRFLLIEDSIKKILPGISDNSIYKFLATLDTSIENGGSGGICSYAATVGSIINYFFKNQSAFKRAFGVDLIYEIVDDNGKKHIEVSQDLIIAELYAYINKGNWDTLDSHPEKKIGPDLKRKINGDWKYKYKSGVYNKRLLGIDQTIVSFYKNIPMSKSLECIPITSYLKSKNLNLGLEMKSIYNSYKTSSDYQNMSMQEKISYLENEIKKSLDNEKYLTISFHAKKDSSLNLYSSEYCNLPDIQLDGGHIMTVTGITHSESDQSVIIKVSTWAGIKYFKLSDYIKNLDEGRITEFNIHDIENNELVNYYVKNEVKLEELLQIQFYLTQNPSANITDVDKLLQNYRMKNYPIEVLLNKLSLASILKNMTLIKQKFYSIKQNIIDNISLKKYQHRLDELEKIKNSEVYKNDSLYRKNIDKEYYKLKNIVDIKSADESVFLKNELNRLVELKKLKPNDIKLNEKIQNLENAINSIEYKKKKISNITGQSIHEVASKKATKAYIPTNILKYSNNHAIEILKNAQQVEKQITNDIQLLESSNSSLIGEENKIKDNDSLTRKIISDASKETKKDIKDLSFSDIDNAAFEIGDGLRYTLLIEDGVYKEKVKSSLDELTKKGYRVVKFKNSWTKPHYKGINVSIQSPTGFLFELQFHTPYSFETKENLTHEFYEINRNFSNSDRVRDIANEIQIDYQSLVDIPEDIIGYNWLNEYNARVGEIEILEEID